MKKRFEKDVNEIEMIFNSNNISSYIKNKLSDASIYFLDTNYNSSEDDSSGIFGMTQLLSNDIRKVSNVLKESTNFTLGSYIIHLLNKKDIENDTKIYKSANISKEYWSKLKSNYYKKPGIEKIFRIGFALKLNLAEFEQLLRSSGYSFSFNSRDAVLIHFISNNCYDMPYIESMLSHFKLPGIFDDSLAI